MCRGLHVFEHDFFSSHSNLYLGVQRVQKEKRLQFFIFRKIRRETGSLARIMRQKKNEKI
jgi:hypothetical protein